MEYCQQKFYISPAESVAVWISVQQQHFYNTALRQGLTAHQLGCVIALLCVLSVLMGIAIFSYPE